MELSGLQRKGMRFRSKFQKFNTLRPLAPPVFFQVAGGDLRVAVMKGKSHTMIAAPFSW